MLPNLLPSKAVLGVIRNIHMLIINPHQIIVERKSFLRDQINPNYNPEANSTFQIQISDSTSIDDYNREKVEAIVKQKKAYHHGQKCPNHPS